jgi:hypothetical protein
LKARSHRELRRRQRHRVGQRPLPGARRHGHRRAQAGPPSSRSDG